MKILNAFIKTLLTLLLVTFLVFVATFFLTIFMPENVLKAIETFKIIFKNT
jgi:hypothetical protein